MSEKLKELVEFQDGIYTLKMGDSSSGTATESDVTVSGPFVGFVFDF